LFVLFGWIFLARWVQIPTCISPCGRADISGWFRSRGLGCPASWDGHPHWCRIHTIQGSLVLVCYSYKDIVLSRCMSCWGLVLLYMRNGWEKQVFSASKERFSLRRSHVPLSAVFVHSPRSFHAYRPCTFLSRVPFACPRSGTSGKSGCTDGF
jgi:hypothetical protein